MPEHQPRAPEHTTHNAERTAAELEAAARERPEQFQHQPEHGAEADAANRRIEAAREAIHHTEAAPEPEPIPAAETETPARPAGLAHLLNPRLNYAHTMTSLQRRLSPTGRRFSRVIHTPAVERVSEALETTVARPSVTAGATWTALIIGALFYFTARRYGYMLSGSEIELSFLIGAALGLFLEWIWRTFIRRPHH